MSSRGILVLLAAALMVASSQAADLTLGSLGPSDRWVQRAAILQDAKAQQVVTTDKTFTTPGGETISQMRLYDQINKDEGARVTVTAGGPGSKFINVHFESKPGERIQFVVDIYGH